MKVFLRNEVIESRISNDAFSLYVCMSILSNIESDHVTFNSKQLEYELYGNLITMPERKRRVITKNINELIKSKSIELILHDKGTYFIKNTFIMDDDNFTIITDDEIRKIMGIDKIDNILLLRYFTFLVSTINLNRKYGWWTIDAISNKLGIHKNSIINYNSILEKVKLIYVYRQGVAIKTESGGYTQVNNTYGRYCDKENIIASSDDYINGIKINTGQYRDENAIINNRHRSISAKYNSFLKGTYSGNTDELKKLCIEYNEHYSKYGDTSLLNMKDLSVFD